MADLVDHELEDIFNFALKVTKHAGQIVSTAFHQEKQFETKESLADLVTETDQAVEREIISTLKQKYPAHQFIGEESIAAGIKSEWTNAPTWIIDPIDGTTNFVHRIPYTAISIGFTVNKDIMFGIVFNPLKDELFTAKKGQGAFCNGSRISVAPVTDPGKSVVIAEFGSARDPVIMRNKLDTMYHIIQGCHGIRSYGSAALNMCNVARGQGHAYYEYGIHVWDIAAGVCIVGEAGGVIIDPSGGKLDILSRGVLCASTEVLAKQLSPLISPIQLERD